MKSARYQAFGLCFCFAMLCFACGNDDPAREAATQQAMESSQNQPPAQQSTPPPQPSAEERNAQRPKDGGTLTLVAEGRSAQQGGEVCVPVKASGFKLLVSMQYSLKWDPNVLKFKELRGFNLPGLSAENFGRHILDKGQLTHSWYDANVRGINRSDGDTLYEICFEVVGKAGSRSAVEFVNAPTFIEIANVQSQFLQLDGQTGMVMVK